MTSTNSFSTTSAPQQAVSDSESDDGLVYIANRGLGALASRMGIEVVEFNHEHAIATMPVEGNTQPIGLLHGGAYVVLGESLGSMHANYSAPSGHVAVGVDINATHTSSATEGTVTGVCVPVHLGRTIAVHEIVVTNEQGLRCSTIRITNLYKQIGGISKANDEQRNSTQRRVEQPS